MTIIFRKVSYQNFLAVGNDAITVQLDRDKTTLVTAINGSGKTTLLDAICFSLYGKAYRNINKPALINSINQKKTLVTIEFDIGKKKYKIVRGMKPNIFEIWCDGVMINQDPNVRDYQKVLENQIIKMNFRAFTQVVVMGSSSYIPFMKLKPSERREFIEDLLDIKVFSVMNKLLSQKTKANKDLLRDTESDIKSTREKIILQEAFVKTRSVERSDVLQKIEGDIKSLKEANVTEYESIATLKTKVDLLNADCLKYSNLQDDMAEVRMKHRNIISQIKKYEQEKSFYAESEECPTCKQTVGESHKTSVVLDIDERISILNLECAAVTTQLEKMCKSADDYNKLMEQVNHIQSDISRHNQIIHGNNLLIAKYEKDHRSKSLDTGSIDEDKRKLKDMARHIVELSKAKKTIIEDQEIQLTAAQLLHDTGIKSKIIKQYIPAINKHINKYLNALEFFCNFNLDENFNEIVKSRHRDEFTYDNFSEGEKMRIDISLLFAWRDIARMKNSINTNLIVMDELMDGSLDQTGLELCIGLLKDMKDTNVFVISHRESIADKFDNTLKLTKKKNFTVMA